VWHDRRIGPGQDFANEIDRHVETDDIILLLVSADFLDSDYCYDKEMTRAIERHEAGDAIVIPVILRACDWHGAPFGKLNATPPDGRPVTQHPDRDQALLEVAKAVRTAAEKLGAKRAPVASAAKATPSAPSLPRPEPRSSNLRPVKQFSERGKDTFRIETFEYMARYFESSLKELSSHNEGIETSYRRIDGNRFSAAVYKHGQAVSRCTIFMGGFASGGIAYLAWETTESNSNIECLTVDADGQSLFMRGMGMAITQRGDSSRLTQEGASEFYWSLLIERLQDSAPTHSSQLSTNAVR